MMMHPPPKPPDHDDAFKISDASFAELARRLEDRTGIVLSEDKRSLAVSRLSRRLKRLGLPGFEAYCDLLEGPNGNHELQEMILLFTTNVTRFFREPHHFETLRMSLAECAAHNRPIRIWSAGCATGEEAFSMAMVVLDSIPDALDRDIRILATDLDRNVLATARRGQFHARAISNSTDTLLGRYLHPCAEMAGTLEVAPQVRSLVQFAELNLLDPWPMQGEFDVIFCRNVVIYFSQDTQQALWPRFANALRPGARLMIGHSERVSGAAADQLISDGVTQYKRIS